MPEANTVAFIAPALVALMPSNPMRSSSSRRSRTPQVKAPCAPPPCRARLMNLVSPFEVGVVSGPPSARSPRWRPCCPLLVEAPAASKAAPVVHREMYGAGSTGGNAERVLCDARRLSRLSRHRNLQHRLEMITSPRYPIADRSLPQSSPRPSGSSPMQRKHCDDTQQAFPLIADYSDTAPREAAWLSDPRRQSSVSRTAAVSAVNTPAAPSSGGAARSSDRGR